MALIGISPIFGNTTRYSILSRLDLVISSQSLSANHSSATALNVVAFS